MTEQLYDYCPRCLWVVDYTCGCEDGQTVFPLVQMTHAQAAAIRIEAGTGGTVKHGPARSARAGAEGLARHD